jgi:hypothetical protein
VRLALDRIGTRAADAALDEPGPHAGVDYGGLGMLRHQWAQGARRRADHGGVAVDALEGRLEAE